MSISLVCLPNTLAVKPSSLTNLSYPMTKSNFVISKPTRFQVKCAQISAPVPVQRRNTDGWAHEIEMSVRDFELDQFGVVNNAIYANYCQHGRHVLMKTFTSSTAEAVARSGFSLATAESSYKFIAPLRSGDRFLVKIRVSGYSKTRLFIEQYVVKLPNEEPILESRSTIIWLDKNYRPMRIPTLMLGPIKELYYASGGSN